MGDVTDSTAKSAREKDSSESSKLRSFELSDAFLGFVEQNPDAIVLTNLQGKPFYANKLARRLLGLKSGDPVKLGLRDYHAEKFWIELRDVAVPAVKRTGSWSGRGKIVSPLHSDPVNIETIITLIRHSKTNQRLCLAFTYRSCGHLLRMEQSLVETETRKNTILESSLDPIITINHEGVITEFNQSAERVFGRKRMEVLGTKPSEILFPPAKIGRYQNRIDRYLDAGEGSLLSKRTEVVAVRSSGLPFEAELTMSMGYERGRPVITFFIRDISRRKRAEEAQRRYAKELERSNQELEQFAYAASHDLQEPLRKIRTFGDRLRRSCEEVLDDKGNDCLNRMQNAAERMQDLIQGLLTLSRVTTKGIDFVPVDLGKVVREVMADLEIPIEKTDAQIEWVKLPTIEADSMQMRQLFQNLLGNAIKFQEKGNRPVIKISSRLDSDSSFLNPVGISKKDYYQITVEDNGIGFDEKYRDRIFDVFQRLHPRDVHKGTGVGLSICRKIVERHGGSIEAKSQEGEGAKFLIRLPVAHR